MLGLLCAQQGRNGEALELIESAVKRSSASPVVAPLPARCPANVKVTPNEWHTLGLRAEGERFAVTYDGKTLYSATDKTFASAGKIALWTKSDSVTRFDQIKITTLP